MSGALSPTCPAPRTQHQPAPTISTLVLPLWPALGEMHAAITLVLRCSCKAWGRPARWGQLGAGLTTTPCPPGGPGSPAPVVRLPHRGSPWPACQAPSHPRDPGALEPHVPRPEPPPAPSPACWPGCIPSPSRSSPARAVELRPRLRGAPAPAPPGAHPTARQSPPGTCADCPGPGSPPGPRC